MFDSGDVYKQNRSTIYPFVIALRSATKIIQKLNETEEEEEDRKLWYTSKYRRKYTVQLVYDWNGKKIFTQIIITFVNFVLIHVHVYVYVCVSVLCYYITRVYRTKSIGIRNCWFLGRKDKEKLRGGKNRWS